MADFDKMFDEIKKNVQQHAETSFSKYKDQAKREVEQFLDSSRDTVKLWTEKLAEGKISISDYEFLVGGLKDIAEAKIMKHAGLAQQRAAVLVGIVLNTIIDVVLKRLAK